jgi:sialic acid synthase SpsE
MGNIDLAREMINLSRDNGADLVKFQLFDPDKLYPKDFPLMKEVKQAQLTFEMAKELFDYGKSIGMEVFFSVFDVERVKWCEEIGVKRYKISTKMRDPEVLQSVSETRKPVIISVLETMRPYGMGFENVNYLYCVPKYPTKLSDVHFEVGDFEQIGDYDQAYDGFSDHTLDLTASKIALARGAQIIERHFSINKQTGVDGMISMTSDELKELVDWAKKCEAVL